MRAKILIREVSDLSERIWVDSVRIELKDATIKSCKASEQDLKLSVQKLEFALVEKDVQIGSYQAEMKDRKKMQRNRLIYFSSGGVACGVLLGLLIR
jgi:hypothetical protein